MSGYSFSTNIEVRFRDLDALGHVNNAVYLTYFEITRLHYWKTLFGDQAFERFSFVVVRAECNFRSPVHLGETLKAAARVSELRRSSFVFSYEIVDLKTGRLVADGTTVQACFDKQEKKAKSIPAELRERILEFESRTKEI
jgi:acyl-CoA thioester hydrolase